MQKIKKFLFVVPNSRWFGKRCWMWFTPAISFLHPILKDYGLQVELLEANIDDLTPEQMSDRIREIKPDIVGITNMSLEYWKQAHEVAKITKKIDKAILTLMGGVHVTSLPEKVMEDPNIDYTILGEGEFRLPQFLDILQTREQDFSKMNGIGFRKNGKTTIIPPSNWVDDLDSLPMPDYSIFDWEKVMGSHQKSLVGMGTRRNPVGIVLTSRGCRYKCSFCFSPMAMGHAIRTRSPEKVLEEIDMLVTKFGIKELIFTDDEMYVDRQRCMDIFKMIKARNYDLIWKNTNLAAWNMDYELIKLMKESGCYQITISPESGSQRVLRKIIHKPQKPNDTKNVVRWCKELGIEVHADFVVGFPGETWEEIRMTANFAEELDADSIKFAIATPLPGTELHKTAVQMNAIPKDFDFYETDYLGFAHGMIETDEFTIKELEMFRCMEWDRITFKTPEKIKKYAEMNGMTLEELEDFRKATRRNVGIYFLDQVEQNRDKRDKVIIGANHYSNDSEENKAPVKKQQIKNFVEHPLMQQLPGY